MGPGRLPSKEDPPNLPPQIAGFLPGVEPAQCHTTWDETGPEGPCPVRVSPPRHPVDIDLTHHCLLCSTLPSLTDCGGQGAPSVEALSTLGILACPANPGHQNPDCRAHCCVSGADMFVCVGVCVTLLALISSELYIKKTQGCIEISRRHLEVTVFLYKQVLFQGRLFP